MAVSILSFFFLPPPKGNKNGTQPVTFIYFTVDINPATVISVLRPEPKLHTPIQPKGKSYTPATNVMSCHEIKASSNICSLVTYFWILQCLVNFSDRCVCVLVCNGLGTILKVIILNV